MGNRAVITTQKAFDSNGIGVYLHWNGGRDSVTAFLTYCKFKGFRSPTADYSYAWARFCQVVGNFFGGSDSIGIGNVNVLDCDNYDNGVYIVDGWEIVDRKYKRSMEQCEYDLEEMLISIDEAQPTNQQLGKATISALVLDSVYPMDYMDKIGMLQVGSKIAVRDCTGDWKACEVLGFGDEGSEVNYCNTSGIPYVGLYGENPEDYARNSNNYLKANDEWCILEAVPKSGNDQLSLV